VRWKNLASHGGRLGELAIAYGLRQTARLERTMTRVCEWRESPSLEKVLEEPWRYGRKISVAYVLYQYFS
jgi:hypothetical protein